MSKKTVNDKKHIPKEVEIPDLSLDLLFRNIVENNKNKPALIKNKSFFGS